MDLRSLVPFRGATPASRYLSDDPFLGLRREIDQIFDDFFGMRGPGRMLAEGAFSPPLDVSQDDRSLTVAVELPGVDQNDIAVTLGDGVLTIKAEKKAESERKDGSVFLAERSFGSLSRSLRLPFAVDQDKVEAAFKNGVLTVTLPKAPEVQESQKKIEVKST